MKSEWRKVRLGDVVTTNNASYSENNKWEFVNYLDTGNITENKIASIQMIDLHCEKLPSRARRIIQKNDIIYSTVRPIQRHYGIIKQIPDNFLVSTGFTTISPTEKTDPFFIYYYLTQNEIMEHLQTLAEQTVSTYPSIKASDIENLQMILPPISTQRAIAATLSCLDDKIELNNRINANLEAQAQAVYEHYFHADKQNGHLSDICHYSEDRIAITTLTSKTYISTENMLSNKAGYRDAASLPQIVQTTKFVNGDVLVSNIRPYFKKILYCSFTGGCSTDVPCFSAVKPELSAFLYCTLYQDRFFDHMLAGSKGTKMPRGDKKQILDYPIVIPNEEVLLQFSNIVSPMLNINSEISDENRILETLCDTLLPKLMSREVDVEE